MEKRVENQHQSNSDLPYSFECVINIHNLVQKYSSMKICFLENQEICFGVSNANQELWGHKLFACETYWYSV